MQQIIEKLNSILANCKLDIYNCEEEIFNCKRFQVFVLQDTDLMKFVFDSDPSTVQVEKITSVNLEKNTRENLEKIQVTS